MTDNKQLSELIAERQDLKNTIALCEHKLDQINSQIFKLLGKKEEAIIDTYKVSVLRKTKIIYDWQGIKEVIGIANWKKVTREIPDPDLLTELISTGRLKASNIANYQSIQKGEPFIRVTTVNNATV